MTHAAAGLTFDPTIPISAILSLILRSLNLVLSVWVMVFSFRSIPRTPLVFQKFRFLGLALLALCVVWGTASRLTVPCTYAALGFTVALIVSVVGTLGFLHRTRA